MYILEQKAVLKRGVTVEDASGCDYIEAKDECNPLRMFRQLHRHFA